MCRLNGRNNGILPKQCEIFRSNNLGVLNPPASIVFTLQNFSINIQYETVGSIAYTVSGYLKISIKSFLANRFEIRSIVHQQATVAGIVGIIFKQVCSA